MTVQTINAMTRSRPHPAPDRLAVSGARAHPVPSTTASSPLDVCLSIALSRLADALSTACTAELEVVGMPAFDPATASWHDEAEAAWAMVWQRAEALALGPGDDSAARWSRRLGRALIDVLDAEGPVIARRGFRRIADLLQDLPKPLRVLEASTLARLRVCLTCLSDLCDAIDGRAIRRAAAPPG